MRRALLVLLSALTLGVQPSRVVSGGALPKPVLNASWGPAAAEAPVG